MNKPSIIVVDDFYEDPFEIRHEALRMEYKAAPGHYKGVRADRPATEKWEAIQSILDLPAIHDRYSCFQKTTEEEPLVYHSDLQRWAGAVYLNPNNVGAGTSFWRSKTFYSRRPSEIEAINRVMFAERNLTSPDEWELVDRIGSVFNRLVLWDASLIHSATSYAGFTEENPRLVQLFFLIESGALAFPIVVIDIMWLVQMLEGRRDALNPWLMWVGFHVVLATILALLST